MSFQRTPSFRSPPSRSSGPVHGIGRRVYVACPDGGQADVILTDQVGLPGALRLRDGSEVEIRAWQPNGKTGTRYCVRSTADGVEGWLGAANLRTSAVRVAPAAVAAPATADPSQRRFGRR